VEPDELLLEGVEKSVVGLDGALDSVVASVALELARDEDLLAGDNLEDLGDEVRILARHGRAELVLEALRLHLLLVEVDVHGAVGLVQLHDEVLVPLLPLPDHLVEHNDEKGAPVRVVEEEELRDVGILDLVVVLGALKAEELVVERHVVLARRDKELLRVLVEGGDGGGRVHVHGRAGGQQLLVQDLSGGLGVLVVWVRVGTGRNVE